MTVTLFGMMNDHTFELKQGQGVADSTKQLSH
jgi:hypothetical protein